MLLATFWATSSPFERANKEGPEPEIEQPKAPACNAANFTSLKAGIKIAREGSMITSTKERPINP